MNKIIFTLIFFIFFVLPTTTFSANNNIDNAGFVPGPIWFSKYPIFAEEKVKIYTAIYNNSEHNIKGELIFLNNMKVIGVVEFKMDADSGAKDVWIDWVAEKGDVEISAEIKNVSILSAENGETNGISFGNNNVAKNVFFVDFDNDKDGVGNIVDEDDDNDGVNDLDEIAQGTNPFLVDHYISSSTKESGETKEIIADDKILDKIDDTVMGFLNKITKNKVDEYVENFSTEQIIKLEIKKEDLEQKINTNNSDYSSGAIKIETIKNTVAPVEEKNLVNVLKSGSAREIEGEQIKGKISLFFKNLPNNIYLYFLKIIIFFLNHTVFLFLLIFSIIYMIIKKIKRIFIG